MHWQRTSSMLIDSYRSRVSKIYARYFFPVTTQSTRPVGTVNAFRGLVYTTSWLGSEKKLCFFVLNFKPAAKSITPKGFRRVTAKRKKIPMENLDKMGLKKSNGVVTSGLLGLLAVEFCSPLIGVTLDGKWLITLRLLETGNRRVFNSVSKSRAFFRLATSFPVCYVT